MKLRKIPLNKVKGKRIILRVDLNIPEGADVLHYRFKRSIPQMKQLIEHDASLVIVTHIGRPKGKERHLSTQKLIPELSEVLKTEVVFAASIPKASKETARVVLLENIRFDKREVKNRLSLGKELASLGDYYVNDAFGVCHRKHASVHAITRYIESFAGMQLHDEVKELSKKMKKPIVTLLGGIKLKTKIPLLKKLAPSAQYILFGSGMAQVYRSMRLRGVHSGMSIGFKERMILKRLIKKYEHKLLLPVDLRIRNREADEELQIRTLDQLQPDDVIVDIGPDTELQFSDYMQEAKTVLWNGPLGVVEEVDGKEGTLAVAQLVGCLSQAHTVIGGGDTVDFLNKHKALRANYVSSGGGAMLAFLAGSSMPGLNVLSV